MTRNLEGLLRITDQLRSRAPDVLSFSFAMYKYRPQSLLDEREEVIVEGDLIRSWFKERLGTLETGWEIALQSKVCVGQSMQFQHHIPMLDLALPVKEGCDPLQRFFEGMGRARLQQLQDLLKDFSIGQFAVVCSGRSYHLYGLDLITYPQWVSLMGRLLLLNKPHTQTAVDSRWVGHRLISGYGSLRWSRLTATYKAWPTLVFIGKSFDLEREFRHPSRETTIVSDHHQADKFEQQRLFG